MKRFLCLILFITSFWRLHAELNPPHRYFELGVDVEAAVANNWFSIPDFFKETLVVDFTDMSKSLKNGLSLNFDMNAGIFMNINAGSVFRMSVFGGIDGTGQFSLSQGIIDFLAKGNTEGDHTITAGAGIDALMYVEAGASFQTFIEKWGISLTPSVFMPIVYIPQTEVQAKVEPIVSGGTRVNFSANAEVYSILGIDQFQTSIDINKLINMNNMGLDVGLGVEYSLFPFLDLGVSVKNIPIIPGRLEYKTTVSASYDYDTNQLFDSLLSEDKNSESSGKKNEPTVNMPEKSEHLQNAQIVRRPTYIGFAASYRPFGDWFNVRGDLDFVINNPFYVNFHIGAGFHLLKMSKMGGHLFNFILTTGYEQRMWTQHLSLVLNFRAFELDLAVSSRSGNFVKSFMGAGLGVGVGVRLGW